ncbi:hypothetical protein C8Q72DRAFT_645270 [Fomitopsis betulina]|nr:hypothetical protein C8Q72DRAFT_113740 [Fomitopsis betulina]KAI0724885.1 hypothetical protein C8Q72DRAFT_645270 [Fomitopsis betulina]
MFFFNIFLVLLPAAVAVPLPYVILPHASATTVSTTPASTAVTSIAHAPDGRDYGNVWKWGHTGNMQSGVSADTEAMEELGHQVRNADAQTVQFAPETQVDEVADAQAEVAQGAQADGQVAMGNPVVITQGAAPPRIHSARSSELCAAPGFMSSRPMPPRVVVCN